MAEDGLRGREGGEGEKFICGYHEKQGKGRKGGPSGRISISKWKAKTEGDTQKNEEEVGGVVVVTKEKEGFLAKETEREEEEGQESFLGQFLKVAFALPLPSAVSRWESCR